MRGLRFAAIMAAGLVASMAETSVVWMIGDNGLGGIRMQSFCTFDVTLGDLGGSSAVNPGTLSGNMLSDSVAWGRSSTGATGSLLERYTLTSTSGSILASDFFWYARS